MPRRENDPLWRLPLWRPYDEMLESKVADINNVGSGGQAGAITAALFMRRFVTAKSWVHFDMFAWTPRGQARPARRRRMPGRARALCAARRALRLNAHHARLRSAPDAGPRRPRRQGARRKSRSGALCRGPRLRGDRAAGAAARRAGARCAALDRGAQGRAGHDLRHRMPKAGPGASSRPTAMSAGCRRTRWRRPARRRPTK